MCEVRIALLPFLHSEISERSRGLRIGGEDAFRSVKDSVGAPIVPKFWEENRMYGGDG